MLDTSYAALIGLTEWGDRWAAPDGPPVLYTHTVCGSGVNQAVVCETCGPLDDAAWVEARPGPGMPAERVDFMDKAMADRSRSSRAVR